jgi:hypothetical protein
MPLGGGGLNLTFFTPSVSGSTMVFIGGVRWCYGRRLGAWGPLVRPARRPSFLLAPHLGIGYLKLLLCWTCRQNGFWKCANTWSVGWGDGANQPHLDSVELVLCATSFSHVIFSVTMPYFWHNEDMHGFWSIWCFSIIWCFWNGRPTKLVELVINKHLSSISWMKCRYVDGKYMHFRTANAPLHLEFCSSLRKRK